MMVKFFFELVDFLVISGCSDLRWEKIVCIIIVLLPLLFLRWWQ